VNYEQTIDYLYNALPMFSRMGSAAYKKDITNTIILCERLGNPQEKFKSIHVGGTNGKGSVSHSLAAIFQTAGYKTGLYTSPHLYDFRERIRINGQMIDKHFVTGFVEKIKPSIEEIEPSFFEITVAMAFDYFAQEEVDIAIIEVGLGGRLDSTNIISAGLAVITNIGWDHMNLLGNTLEEIAFEKAGIIKQNAPVVIGEKKNQTQQIFINTAEEKNAPIYFAEDKYAVEDYSLSPEAISVAVLNKQYDRITKYDLDLPGIYQLKNILTILQAIDLVPGYRISESIVQIALRNVKGLTGLHGRWELIHREPFVVLEVAHNKEGVEQMLEHINRISFERLRIVFGTVNDKDVQQVLALLPSSASYYFTRANIPRALDAKELMSIAKSFSLRGETYADVNEALKNAISQSSKNDLIVVCGSIFLVAEVERKLLADS
jgi:dihydrofolate synthase/folylpolyglutamate synthase